MSYQIVDGYVIHDSPVYTLDEEGIPNFLKDNDRFWWKFNMRLGRKQVRYSSKGYYAPHYRDEREEKDGKVYVCYSYRGDGAEWRECFWEQIKVTLSLLIELAKVEDLSEEALELLKQARIRHRELDERMEEQVRLKRCDEELLNKTCSI